MQSTAVEIIEVSPRDGLQNESVSMSTAQKLELIRRAIAAGTRRIEVASFVHPRRVPQMADAEAVCAGLPDRDDVTYVGLVLNDRGLQRAIDTGRIDEVGCVAVASDGFGLSNQNQTVEQSVAASQRIIAGAHAAGMRAQVTISVAFGCPFDGAVSHDVVVDIARRLADVQPDEIALADTIGVAVPGEVSALIGRVRAVVADDIPLRAHFHNTRNTAIANAQAAIASGIRCLDSSIGGIGGCPFAPRATGNVATEDLLYLIRHSDIRVDLDMTQTIDNARWLEAQLGKPLPGMVSRAGDRPA